MLNKVQIIGRLGADPDLKYLPSGAPVCNLSVATDESYQDKDGNKVQRTEWHRVTVFQRSAENCKNYLFKGSLVYVEGSLQTRKWQDQQGNDRYTTEIKAQRVQFLDRKGEGSGGQYGQGNQGGYGGGSYGQDGSGGFMNDGGQMGQGGYGSENFGASGQPRQSAPRQNNQGQVAEGSPFPSEASDMDNFPF